MADVSCHTGRHGDVPRFNVRVDHRVKTDGRHVRRFQLWWRDTEEVRPSEFNLPMYWKCLSRNCSIRKQYRELEGEVESDQRCKINQVSRLGHMILKARRCLCHPCRLGNVRLEPNKSIATNGARTLLVAPGTTTNNKKLPGTKLNKGHRYL